MLLVDKGKLKKSRNKSKENSKINTSQIPRKDNKSKLSIDNKSRSSRESSKLRKNSESPSKNVNLEEKKNSKNQSKNQSKEWRIESNKEVSKGNK